MKLLRILLIISVVPVLSACVSRQKGGADFYMDHYRCRDAANASGDRRSATLRRPTRLMSIAWKKAPGKSVRAGCKLLIGNVFFVQGGVIKRCSV